MPWIVNIDVELYFERLARGGNLSLHQLQLEDRRIRVELYPQLRVPSMAHNCSHQEHHSAKHDMSNSLRH